MVHRKITAVMLTPELRFTTSRSSGPGGQNVNKVNSRVTLEWDIMRSTLVSDDERALLVRRFASRMTAEGLLKVSAQENRSQVRNKEAVVQKLDLMLARALEKKKKRKATKPTKGSVQDRLKSKKRASEKKKWRQKPG